MVRGQPSTPARRVLSQLGPSDPQGRLPLAVMSRILLLTLALVFVAAGSRAEDRSPLHGSLVPGPHPVGFTTIRMTDPTRPQGTARVRALVAHVWYPAADTAKAPMTFADVMAAHLDGASAAAIEGREAETRRFLAQFGEVSDAAWTTLRTAPMLARRDAKPAPGPFPLIIGELRPTSTSITNEYLASHGYVVGMVYAPPQGPDPSDPGAGLEIGYRDMEFAIPELRKLPHVDPVSLAALGFSGAGFSQILLAMRHPDVKAVCDLESAIFDDRMMWPLYRGWGYDVAALRVPFLHTYSVPLSARESRIADFENMRYATRYRYLVDVPGIHHWDFATEGMAASAVLKNRGEHNERLRQAFETTNRYVLAFFDAYVKGDAEALSFLRTAPEANGIPAGLVTIRELPAVPAAPTTEAFGRILIEQGVDRGMAMFDEARKQDPEAALFRENDLNVLGYRLLRQQKHTEAIAIFRKAVELFPTSANPYDSLSEALEAAGNRAEAMEVAKKGLEVLARQDLPEASRDQLRELLEKRIERLGGRLGNSEL